MEKTELRVTGRLKHAEGRGLHGGLKQMQECMFIWEKVEDYDGRGGKKEIKGASRREIKCILCLFIGKKLKVMRGRAKMRTKCMGK